VGRNYTPFIVTAATPRVAFARLFADGPERFRRTASRRHPAARLASMDVESALGRVAGEVPGIVSLYLFGSVLQGREHGESDIDIGILLDRKTYPSARDRFAVRLLLGTRLSDAAGRPADIVILNDAPPQLGRAIVTAGRRVRCADAEADLAFVRDVQLLAADLEPFLRRTRRLKLEAGKHR
jgi:predicted nucleotidyltransferase